LRRGNKSVGKWAIANSANQGDRQYETTPFPEVINPLMVKISKKALEANFGNDNRRIPMEREESVRVVPWRAVRRGISTKALTASDSLDAPRARQSR
jgi:hypothetical protein